MTNEPMIDDNSEDEADNHVKADQTTTNIHHQSLVMQKGPVRAAKDNVCDTICARAQQVSSRDDPSNTRGNCKRIASAVLAHVSHELNAF